MKEEHYKILVNTVDRLYQQINETEHAQYIEHLMKVIAVINREIESYELDVAVDKIIID